MKSPDGFDARRLRPSKPQSLRWRLGAVLSALCITLGTLTSIVAAASLFGHPPELPGFDGTMSSGAFLLGSGLLLLWVGILTWRFCRRRLHRPGNNLSLSPHLLKKRN